MKKYAIIVAGGSGQRMGSALPKQFMLLKGIPLLQHTVQAFLHAYNDIEIILVLPENYIDQGNKIVSALNNNQIKITTGGHTRFHSVKNGLQQITEPSVIFVHDGVRCLVSPQLIKACYHQCLAKGSAIPAVTPYDSLRIISQDSHKSINRESIRIIQTPQTFLSHIILPAFNQEFNDLFTDEATVVEASGQSVHLIEGDYANIKITRPVDLTIATAWLETTS